MKSSIKTIIRDFLLTPLTDVLYPPLCHYCDQLLPVQRRIICRACWENIPPFQGILDKSLQNRSFDNIYILFEYEEIIQMLIHLLKYNRYLSLTHYFAEETLIRYPYLINRGYDAIIPVPLYKSRERERGYNQSEEISLSLSSKLNIPVKKDLILRQRHTLSQTTMSKQEREANVRDAFVCPDPISEDVILLVDDVITTGSTTEACLNCLRNAGVAEVDVFSIAHPPPERLK
jgi:competence protein ComFC